ncbi:MULTISPECIES: recombinase family protein [Eubacteriales]|uniref:recombinase family protein n=1 Tax=Eubacteriales TaxID=186802 RepID=UPI001370815B|nr:MULTISPECIES: recombinase family protein [unclassified Neglectibacter]NBI18394.1 recombinase [Neglectibacter sp. 59]NBJ74067.1 recombinase [Neglectibacter sp. X4]NCE81907.1 recombinase [Neglectibacter sp. X58]
MKNLKTQVWNACGYVRLSREDGDKEESNSVTGQKDLIRDYLSRHEDLHERGMKVDDGFTGSNFQRPAFQEMMGEVKAGKINCIVVKDLSRFGRNHLEAGEYIERIFPFLGVRFIAINDHYDSLHSQAESDEILVPFKNLINEAYCRDTSIKIRSQLEIKRQRGDFIGSFTVFGYQKDPADRHKLVIDEYAADVVRDIFNWKLDGISALDIAAKLTASGIPTPMDYKQSLGMRYNTSFRIKEKSVWDAAMVLRILKNPVYIGVLEQGRITTPSYKVKRIVQKPRDEWAVIENNHEPIIDKFDFETTQRVLAMDTRTAQAGQPVELFSGITYCGECGGAMIRKTVPYGKKKYVYYVCANHKERRACYPHSLRTEALENIVLEALQAHIQEVCDLEDLSKLADSAQLQQAKMRKLQARLDKKQEEIDRMHTLLRSLYENLADGILDQDEYKDLKKTYTQRREEAEQRAELLREEMDRESASMDTSWMEQFRHCRNIIALDRRLVVSLIVRVIIFRDKRVEIVYRWQNEFDLQRDLLRMAQAERQVG